MALQNFVDGVGPVIDAAWLNAVDVIKETTVPELVVDVAALEGNVTQLQTDVANFSDSSSAALGDALLAVKSVISGSGARTQHEKNADIYSPEDAGAVGDWNGVTGTDDTAAIQRVVTNGLPIRLTPGKRYLVTAPIVVPAGKDLAVTGKNRRTAGSIHFQPSSNGYLFDNSANGNTGIQIDNLVATGSTTGGATLVGFLLGKKSGVTSTRLRMSACELSGFTHTRVFDLCQCIESYVYDSYFQGPHSGGSVGPTTTRTSDCFFLDTPWNTTVFFVNCFMQGWRFAINSYDTFTLRVWGGAYEDNFISIQQPRVSGTVQDNQVRGAYFENNKYSLGGAGLAADFSDIGNSAKFGVLLFENNYHANSAVYGGSSISDCPATPGGMTFSAISQIGRQEHFDFLPSQRASYKAGQFVSFFDGTPGYDAINVLGTSGVQWGFRKDVNNGGAGIDNAYRAVLKTGNGAGNPVSWCLLGNTDFDSGNPVQDGWDAAAEATRMRIQGANGYLGGGGAWNTAGADYAEMFEWVDGNPNGEDRIGWTVKLVGGKIAKASPGDAVIGVISGTASIIGNNWSEGWCEEYLRDDFGRQIRDAEGRLQKNPLFIEGQVYLARSERPEWACVGLVGRLRIRKEAAIPPGWHKLRDVSASVAEYLIGVNLLATSAV